MRGGSSGEAGQDGREQKACVVGGSSTQYLAGGHHRSPEGMCLPCSASRQGLQSQQKGAGNKMEDAVSVLPGMVYSYSVGEGGS